MSQQVSTTLNEPQEPVAINDRSSVELPQEVVVAIADYLDVFIEIDLQIKQPKQGEEDELETKPKTINEVSR